MPTGRVKWFDPRTGEGRIARYGREYPIVLGAIEAKARAPGARVHFDVRRDLGVSSATNVRLDPGKRTSHRHHRFGDLVGAAQPDAKGHAPLTHQHRDLDLNPGPQPMRVVRAWLDALMDGDLPTALMLYASDARVHAGGQTLAGRRGAERALQASTLLALRGRNIEIQGEDSAIVVRWKAQKGASGGTTRVRIEHDRIAEQWI